MSSVRKVFAVPRQQIIDAVHGRYRDVQGIRCMFPRNGTFRRKEFREGDRLFGHSQDSEFRDGLQPYTGSRRISCRCFLVYKFRDHHLEMRGTFFPPPVGEPLVRGNDHVGADPTPQIADYTGLYVDTTLHTRDYTSTQRKQLVNRITRFPLSLLLGPLATFLLVVLDSVPKP